LKTLKNGRKTRTRPTARFGSLDAAYGLAYGHTRGKISPVGLGLSYVRQTLDSVSAGAPTGTVGALWQTPISFLTLGAAVRNIGGSIKFVEEGDPLPTTAALGATGRFMKKRLLLSVETRQVQNEDIAYGAGVEVSPPISKDAVGHLRAGYRSERQNTLKMPRGSPWARRGISPLGVRPHLGSLRRPGRHVPIRLSDTQF
jgi:hypothetical protein